MKILIITFLISFSAFGYIGGDQDEGIGGTEVGNGGDSVAQEFITLGYRIAGSLMQGPIEGVDSVKLLSVVTTTKVMSRDNLVLNGAPVTAINYPSSKVIEVDINRWNRTKSFMTRAYLVLHEYLWIMGIDDTNYKVSHKLVLGQLPTTKDYMTVILNNVLTDITSKESISNEFQSYVKEVSPENVSFEVLYNLKNYFYSRDIDSFEYHTVYLNQSTVHLGKLLQLQYNDELRYIAIYGDNEVILSCDDSCSLRK